MAVLKYYDETKQKYLALPLGTESVAVADWNYSTEEQVVGEWIDGKPLYRIVSANGNDNLIPICSSNTSNILYSSQYNDTYAAWHAFDRNSNSGDFWQSTALPSYIGYNFGTSTPVNNYVVINRYLNSDDVGVSPTTWKFQGSNDGSTWADLDSQTVTWTAAKEKKSFNLSNTCNYKMYRLYITAIMTASYGQSAISQFQVGMASDYPTSTTEQKMSIETDEGNYYVNYYTKTTDAENSFNLDMLSTGSLETEATEEEVAAVLS